MLTLMAQDPLKEKIIYEDKNYIVINKDAGIAVHGGSKNYIGIIDIARKIYGKNIYWFFIVSINPIRRSF